jgi:hypothetical protein
MEKVFKIYINLQTFFSSIFICILGGIRLSCLPLNCHYHQIGFALKQVVPVSYYDDPYTLLSFILNEFVADVLWLLHSLYLRRSSVESRRKIFLLEFFFKFISILHRVNN